MSRTTKSAS